MFYLVPPAGTPITLMNIFNIIKMRIFSDSLTDRFEEIIRSHTNGKHCFLFNSGRTALASILNSLYKLADNRKDEVVIPAYTCFSVAAAIVKRGMKIRLVDIDPLTMDYDYEKLRGLNFKNVLAIVGCNLFGILSDWNILVSIAKVNNVYLIDDAAQALGTLSHAKASGNLGDAGFFSLNRGKNLSTISGGILITNNEQIASNIYRSMKDLKKNKYIFEMKMLLRIMLYALFINPRLYWLPDKMPFLKLGQTVFDENFSISNLSNLQRCAGAVMFPKLNDINAIRSKNAKAICDVVLDDARFHIPGYSPDGCPIYLRLPVLAQNRHERDKIITTLRQAGIKSSVMYPSTIRRIEGIEKYLANPEDDFEGAQTVVDQLFTLPTHHYVKDRDIDKIIDCLMGK